jgi:acetylglutamate kinase
MDADIGLVGEVSEVNPAIINTLLENGHLPVISPIGTSAVGTGLNLNADLVAGAIGGALKADQVLYMTDVAGIYRNWPDTGSLIESISASELSSLLPTFSDGMIPKVTSALSAIDAGAKSVRIFDGRELVNFIDALNDSGGTVVLP